MPGKTCLVLVAVCAAAIVSPAAWAKHDPYSTKLPKDKKIVHALRRLTFGPRPGDIERVRKLGLDKWIDLQLHPERIAENPLLADKLRPLESLGMSPAEIVKNYPPPQVLKALADGRLPYPQDPGRRKIVERLVARYRQFTAQKQPAMPEAPDQAFAQLAGLLDQDTVRKFRAAPPPEKARLILSVSADKRERVLDILPDPMRRQIYTFFPTPLQRRVLWSFAPQQVVTQDLDEAKLYRAIYGNRQLEEVLTDFWFNHFNVFLDKGADHYLVTAYERDAIRPHMLGKFKDLLLATAQSPAMLFYLDNWQSSAPGPNRRRGLNENYGRELLELHTLGVDGGYTQQDVIEVARCFTGWTIKTPQLGGGFTFNERMHDKGEKTVLGVKIPAGGGIEDGMKVIDILAHHPSTARFISRELAVRFVSDNPPAQLVDHMAKTFLNSGGDLREVMRTMLRSKEFFSEGAWQGKIKSPLDDVASAVRALDAQVDSAVGLAYVTAQMGEPLYRKMEPTGYSNAGAEWVNSAALLARMNFALGLAANRIPGVHAGLSRFDKAQPDELASLLLPGGASEETLAAVTRSPGPPAAVAGLLLGSPDFQHK